MRAPKIITGTAFIANIIGTYNCFVIFLSVSQSDQKLMMQFPFPWFFLIPPVFAIGSLIFWFYLRNKEKRGEKVKFALLISILLLLIPFFVVPPIITKYLIGPLYNLLQTF